MKALAMRPERERDDKPIEEKREITRFRRTKNLVGEYVQLMP